jgi:hypothetical protein
MGRRDELKLNAQQAVDCGRRIKPLSVLVGSTDAGVAASGYKGSFEAFTSNAIR